MNRGSNYMKLSCLSFPESSLNLFQVSLILWYYMVIPQEVFDMPTRKRVAMTVSLPPDIAREYESIAKAKGETKSQLFREMFRLYRQDKLDQEFFHLQRYGCKKAQEIKLTEKDIEKLVFEGR